MNQGLLFGHLLQLRYIPLTVFGLVIGCAWNAGYVFLNTVDLLLVAFGIALHMKPVLVFAPVLLATHKGMIWPIQPLVPEKTVCPKKKSKFSSLN